MINEKFFHIKPNNSNKLYYNICESHFVKHASNANLRRHFTKYYKKELDDFDINNISSELTRLEKSTSYDEEISDTSSISNISHKNNNFIKGLMKGFDGQGEIDIINEYQFHEIHKFLAKCLGHEEYNNFFNEFNTKLSQQKTFKELGFVTEDNLQKETSQSLVLSYNNKDIIIISDTEINYSKIIDIESDSSDGNNSFND
ncbi:507_t:CDS:2 [Scutellospora calospora]|uniref:507_t:CDS:1 n=1 Tax=Scutellospora calospora TaxID=85575 RepID=A0ACA9KHU2_9GLOM|nr:507_t:CDS:2 [Scutellospora calospora]